MKYRVSFSSCLIIILTFSFFVIAAEMYTYEDITPILNQNGCVGCHSGFLGSYSALVAQNSIAGQTDSVPIIYPANADSSVIVWRLEGKLPDGGSLTRMPRGGASLDAATIQKVKDWIDQGAVEETVAVERKSWTEIKSMFKD